MKVIDVFPHAVVIRFDYFSLTTRDCEMLYAVNKRLLCVVVEQQSSL